MVNCYFQDGHIQAKILGDLTSLNVEWIFGQLQQEIEARGVWKIILDCGDVSIVDSSAIGGLVKLAREAQENGGYILIANANANTLEVLYYSKLEKVLRPFTAIDKALAYAEELKHPHVEQLEPTAKPGGSKLG